VIALLLSGAPSASVGLPIDFAVLTGTLVVLVAISARLYPNIAR
jgi:hypothetical protein